ncbi:MAG: hypothetical protein OEY86_07535 [Nitrospira sp.]|nr:hypothetical protein [Nitrospira sp.]
MKPVILAMTLAAALAVNWIYENVDCLLFSAGTDTCVGCTDDCLEPMEK